MFLFCITMEPVYARMRAAVGDEGVLYTYCDDSYMLAPAEQMATSLQQAPGIFAKVGLRLGYGPRKTELILPKGYSRQNFPFPRDDPDVAAPQVIAGFKSCLGVPRHFENDPEFLHEALHAMGTARDRLLDLIEEVTDEDPFAALRLLQTCGIFRFRHVLSADPPATTSPTIREREGRGDCGNFRHNPAVATKRGLHTHATRGSRRGGSNLIGGARVGWLPRSLLPDRGATATWPHIYGVSTNRAIATTL